MNLHQLFELSSIQPIDLKYGHNLLDHKTQQMVIKAVRELRPLLLVVAWPCTRWSLFSENLNYSKRLEFLEQLREEDRPLVKFGEKLCKIQISEGRFFLGENPLRSRLWDEIQELLDHPDCLQVRCDAGAFGAENSEGSPILKPHLWITNPKSIASRLDKTMSAEQKMYAQPIAGKETAKFGEYCDGLAGAILDGLREEAAIRNPSRFARTLPRHEAFYAKLVQDQPAWEEILKELGVRFMNTHKKPFVVSTGDPLMKSIEVLVPWEITRVQAAWCPSARRFPQDITYTHRACVMKTNEEEFFIEDEDLAAVPYPKQRFSQPVRVALFIYGLAEDDDLPSKPSRRSDQQDEDEVQEPAKKLVPGLRTDIWFEGSTVPRELQASVSRLHCNLGHAPKAEIIRILAASGRLSSGMLNALEAMRCGSCIRSLRYLQLHLSNTMDFLETIFKLTSSSSGSSPDKPYQSLEYAAPAPISMLQQQSRIDILRQCSRPSSRSGTDLLDFLIQSHQTATRPTWDTVKIGTSEWASSTG